MICLKGQFTRLSRPDANFKYKFWPEMTERFTTMPEVASRQNSKLKSHRTATLERLHRTREQTFNCSKKLIHLQNQEELLLQLDTLLKLLRFIT